MVRPRGGRSGGATRRAFELVRSLASFSAEPVITSESATTWQNPCRRCPQNGGSAAGPQRPATNPRIINGAPKESPMAADPVEEAKDLEQEIGRRQSLFRELNERIEELADTF